jgi:hypothetical protein
LFTFSVTGIKVYCKTTNRTFAFIIFPPSKVKYKNATSTLRLKKKKSLFSSWEWWLKPALRRQRQEAWPVQGQPQSHSRTLSQKSKNSSLQVT